MISPADNSILPDNTPTFDWSDVTDPSGVTYTFEILGVLTKSSLASSTYTLADDEALSDGDYYWRVRSVDGASNESSWSSVWWIIIKVKASVFTKDATDIGAETTALNASVYYGVYEQVDIHFNYRQKGVASWLSTPWEDTESGYCFILTGLNSGTTFEFRAHIRFDYSSEDFGDVLEFKTKATYIPPYIPPTSTSPSPSVVFDVRLDVYPKEVPKGEAVTLRIDIYRVQGGETVDAIVNYKIIGPDGEPYALGGFTEAIYAKIYDLPFYTFWPLGDYTAHADISWPGGTAEATDTFEVVEASIIERLKLEPIILGMIGGIVAVVIVILIYLRKKRFS